MSSSEEIYDRDDLFKIADRISYGNNIFPNSPQQVDRIVKIGRGCQVNGSIYGSSIEILDGFSPNSEEATKTLSLFGRDNIKIGDFCTIEGNVSGGGSLSIGANSNVLGSAIAPCISSIGQGTKIKGNLISEESIIIEDDVSIGGYVITLNGNISIGKNSKAYDIIAAGDILINDEVILSDPVVWTKEGKIEFSKFFVGKTYPISSDLSKIILPNEINPYIESKGTCDYQKLLEELENTLQVS